jgi:hypothetical protein
MGHNLVVKDTSMDQCHTASHTKPRGIGLMIYLALLGEQKASATQVARTIST